MQVMQQPSVIDAETMVRYLVAAGKHSAKLETVVQFAYDFELLFGIRADIICLQIFKETGYGSSEWFLKFNNCAGIGVTGITSGNPQSRKPDPVAGTDWQWMSDGKWHQGLASWDVGMGVGQVFGHHVAYLRSEYDPHAAFYDARYDLLFNLRKGQPPLVTIADYSNKWAQTWVNGVQVPNTYGESIESMYNTVLAWAAAHPAPTAPAPASSVTEPAAPVIFVPETAHQLGGGFKGYWYRLERVGENFRLVDMGWPLTDEFAAPVEPDGSRLTVQLFERGGLVFHPGQAAPWDVTRMTLAQETAAYDYAITTGLIKPDAKGNVLIGYRQLLAARDAELKQNVADYEAKLKQAAADADARVNQTQAAAEARLKPFADKVANYAMWAEILQNTFVNYVTLGWTTERISIIDHMIKALRNGLTYEQYQAAATTKQ